MSCGCNSNPCSCQPRPSVCCAPEQESVLYTFENANLVGIGVFDNETDFLVQFRGLVSLSSSLTLALNATDNTIEIDFDDAALVADIPDATTTQRGILETATNAEALAKAATDKIVTPSNFAAMASTTTFAGLVELATEAETIAGVSTTLAVTPAGLAAAGQLTGTTTFADAVARAAAVPAFQGQFGAQDDSGQPYVAYGAAAGQWAPMLTFGIANISSSTTSIDLSADQFIFSNGDVVLDTGELHIGPSSTIVIEPTTVIEFGGGAAGANSLFSFNASAEAEDIPISNFLSSSNTSTGWTNFSNSTVRKTGDCNTITLPELAQVVDTLIQTLGTAKLIPIP